LTRHQALHGMPIVSMRHATVPLEAADRVVLGCLDGEHDRQAIIERIERAVREEGLRLDEQGSDGTGPATEQLDDWLERRLYQLAKSALLVG
jgi:methyltransferase-like protein